MFLLQGSMAVACVKSTVVVVAVSCFCSITRDSIVVGCGCMVYVCVCVGGGGAWVCVWGGGGEHACVNLCVLLFHIVGKDSLFLHIAIFVFSFHLSF